MSRRQASGLKRLTDSNGKALLDEKRLEAIRKRIAGGFYNRNDVQRSIVDRLAHRLAEEREADEKGKGDSNDADDTGS